MEIHSTPVRMTLGPVAELDRLGDEIAELSAHLEAASARLLDLIREFDARGGWNTRAQRAHPGWASASMLATRSTSCIPSPTHSRQRPGERATRRRRDDRVREAC
jgi:hypothetical protein